MNVIRVQGNRAAFFCPGCGYMEIWVNDSARPAWTWNGSLDKPTFSPSILSRSYEMSQEAEMFLSLGGRTVNRERWDGRDTVCHSFVEEGKIRFLADCTHQYAGQTLDLPPFDDDVV